MEPTGFCATKFIVLFALFSYSVSAVTFPQGFQFLPTLPITIREPSPFPYREMATNNMERSENAAAWFMMHEFILETKEELAHLRNSLAATNANLATTNDNFETTNTNLGTVKSELAAVKKDLGTTNHNLETTNRNLGAVTTDLADVKIDLGKTNNDLETTSTKLGAVKADLAGVKIDLGKTKDNLGNVKTDLASVKNDLGKTKNHLETTSNNLGTVNRDLSDVKEELDTANSNLRTVKRDLNDLNDIVDVPPISFYVQRTSSFSDQNVPITFQSERLNLGEAMDIDSGIFKAPRSGIYFFSFTGIGGPSGLLDLGLYLNGNRIASGTIANGVPVPTFSIQSTLQLNKNDEISARIYGGTNVVYDDDRNFLHFTGFLLRPIEIYH